VNGTAEMLAMACWLVHERGFSVIPLDHPAETTQTDPKRIGKVPVLSSWKAFQSARATDDNLQAWFGNGQRRNIAIVTGAVSSVVVVDCDSPEAIAWADQHLPATEMRTRTGRGGEHRFYQHPGIPVRNKVKIQTDQARLALDVRGDGGFVVGPGSVHETGVVYEKLGQWPAVEALPVFDPTWIAAPASPTTPSNTVLERNRNHILTRARAYLAQVPPAIQGQGGDEHTFKAACKLVLGFALTDSDAFDLLRDWNHGCVPPWTDRELEAKIAAARKYGMEPMGARAADRNLQLSHAGPIEVSAAPRVVVPAERKIRFRTAAELASEQPNAPVWCVYGLLALGVITELAGKLKASGKTTFAAHLVRALLDGLPFLGHPTRKTAVVWLTEERPATFLETLRRARLETRIDLHVLAWHDVKGMPFPDVMGAAVTWCKHVGAEVLIIDTISQFAGLRGDAENNSGDALAAIEPLQMAAAQGLAVLVPRHERKGGGDVGESGRGSSAFSGAVDIVVVIRRGEGQSKPTVRVLHTLSRFTETPDTLVMELTDTGYVALGTEGTVAVLEAERALLDRLPYGEAAALSLDAALEGVTLRVARTNAQAAVKNLMSIGQVQRVGLGKRGDGYRYFRTVEVSAGTQTTECGRKHKLE
jgi:Bifunctional DNA primase/polymerase, N-terminal/AAA domain